MIIKQYLIGWSTMSEQQTKKSRPTFDELIQRINWPFNRFFLFLIFAIMLALLMGFVSYKIYQSSDAASLDLSLPEHQNRLREENRSLSSEEKVIDPTGKVDDAFANQVREYLQHYEESVGETKPFAPDALLDENLINLSPTGPE